MNINRRLITLVLVITLLTQTSIFPGQITSPPQLTEEEIEESFNYALGNHQRGRDDLALCVLERFIVLLKECPDQDLRGPNLGKFNLLLAMVYEKKGLSSQARIAYNLARQNGVESIPGIDAGTLQQFHEIMQGPAVRDIAGELELAKAAYRKGDRVAAKLALENIIDNPEQGTTGDILGKSHLLLGAIHERAGKISSAEYNYDRAKSAYGVQSVPGINLEKLPVYGRVVKGKLSQVIEVPGTRQRKKFPWLILAGGVVITAALLYFLVIKKKKKKEYTLTVTVGEGVSGTPATGSYIYKENETITYQYSLKTGYSNLTLTLDGNPLNSNGTGTITMNRNHSLVVSAGENQVTLVTSSDTVSVPEGKIASFQVKLSAEPAIDIIVSTSRIDEESDQDITIQSGAILSFNSSNWNTYQPVTLAAANDSDHDNGEAVFRLHADDTTIPDKTVTATENDDGFILTLCGGDSYDFSEKTKADITEGDFYFDNEKNKIRADLPGQWGIAVIGVDAESELSSIAIPSDPNLYQGKVEPVIGCVYVAEERERDMFVVFRLITIEFSCIAIKWIRKARD